MIARLDEGFSAQRQFTGNAAHELRTPLALMQAQVELFCAEHPDVDADTASLLGLLQEQTERMTHMTKTLLEMSELRSVPCNDVIDLAPMIEEVLTDLAPLAEQKDITLTSEGDAQTIGSDTLIYRLLFNLAENAIRYSAPNSTVQINACAEGDRVLLRVRDQGPGIPEQYQTSIFSLLSRRQIAQQGIRRRGAGACAGLGDRRAPRRLHRGRKELGARNDHARDSSHSRTRLIKITNGWHAAWRTIPHIISRM